jgi:hypothetical protein
VRGAWGEEFLTALRLRRRRAFGKTPPEQEVTVSSDVATRIPERAQRLRERVARRQRRALAIQLLGPITMLGGLVWAVAQPYRIAFLDTDGKGAYDYLVKAPLLVVAVGLVFALLIAPGLVEDLEGDEEAEGRGSSP